MSDDIVTSLQARCCLLASQSPNDEGALLAIQAANEIARLRAENERLNGIITLWIDCCLNLDIDRFFTPEDKIEKARKGLRKARRETYKEETRRKHANT